MRNEEGIRNASMSETEVNLWEGYVNILLHLIENDLLVVWKKKNKKDYAISIDQIRCSLISQDGKEITKIFLVIEKEEDDE